jgi:hypothetical protein
LNLGSKNNDGDAWTALAARFHSCYERGPVETAPEGDFQWSSSAIMNNMEAKKQPKITALKGHFTAYKQVWYLFIKRCLATAQGASRITISKRFYQRYVIKLISISTSLQSHIQLFAVSFVHVSDLAKPKRSVFELQPRDGPDDVACGSERYQEELLRPLIPWH